MDGRDRKDYEASHVPGAISMPYFDLYFEWRSTKYVALAQRVVASGRHVVCYANTGGTEGMGAGRCMRLCNFFYECWKVPVDRMHRLRDGYADWKKRGFPVSTVDSDEVPRPPRYVAAPREEEEDDDGASVATAATTSFAKGLELRRHGFEHVARLVRLCAHLLQDFVDLLSALQQQLVRGDAVVCRHDPAEEGLGLRRIQAKC